MNIEGFRPVWTAGTLVALSIGVLHAETESKPMFSNSEVSAIDQALAHAKDAGARTRTTHAITDIFAAKAAADLEDKIKRDISEGKPKTPFTLDRATQGKRIKDSLGEERLGRVRQFLQDNLDSGSMPESRSAMWWFLMIDPESTAKSRVISQLTSKHADVRFEAARQLAMLSKDSAGESVLVAELGSREISRALLSAEALGKLKNDKARLKALEVYNSTTAHEMVRATAVTILSDFQTPDAEQVVVKALDDSSPQVVIAVLGRLQARSYPLNRHAINRLFEIIDDRTVESSTKMMTVWALQHSKNRERSQIELRHDFTERLKSPDLGIAVVAVTGLMVFGEKKDAKQLVPLLDHPSDALKVHVERSLGRISGVRFDQNERDVKVMVAKRKGWWAQHSGDSEYR